MIKLKLVAASAILSAGIANPAFAQAIIQESGALRRIMPPRIWLSELLAHRDQ